ncbi:hypothetical protein SERLA73DRAFT_163047 [Serpula lacrymans var. lacrymans S7.3]|uniref:Uncharacterized protein n=1 Tax=Serpula lacrymans var. lacrymans (strain S7.3) TaxID=936435 RepID=F8QB75_SERL3|nr:hypothetical protein SERLA73DRAFT_163047 [Serpula lacrymans var. lacrymans S7.3]
MSSGYLLEGLQQFSFIFLDMFTYCQELQWFGHQKGRLQLLCQALKQMGPFTPKPSINEQSILIFIIISFERSWKLAKLNLNMFLLNTKLRMSLQRDYRNRNTISTLRAATQKLGLSVLVFTG